MSSTVIDCGNARLIVTRLADPIGELTLCFEIHEVTGGHDGERYQASVAFVLMSDQESKMLGEALGNA